MTGSEKHFIYINIFINCFRFRSNKSHKNHINRKPLIKIFIYNKRFLVNMKIA
jgi:hypothetical protein